LEYDCPEDSIFVDGGFDSDDAWEKEGEELRKSSQILKVSDFIDRHVKKELEVFEGDVGEEKEFLRRHLDVFSKLWFVKIQVPNSELDPHEIFERLNDRGVPLTSFDLLRNFLLMKVTSGIENHPSINRHEFLNTAYNNNMKKFEEIWKTPNGSNHTPGKGPCSKRLESYIFSVAQIRNPKTTKSGAFHSLRDHYENDERFFKDKKIEDMNKQDRLDLLKAVMEDLSEFKPVTESLRTRQFGATTINRTCSNRSQRKKLTKQTRRFGSLAHKVLDESTIPYVYQVFKSMIDKEISVQKGTDCLEALEAFIVRRSILGQSRKGLSLFKGLWDVSDGQTPVKQLLEAIEKSDESWVSDNGLKEFLDGSDEESFRGVYGSGKRKALAHYLIWEYDLSQRSDLTEEIMPIDNDLFTIDHINPQSNGSNWRFWTTDTHREWVNNWGNLVPLTQEANSSKGAQDFKTVKKRFRKGLTYTTAREVFEDSKVTVWKPKNVAARAKKISVWACKRWPDKSK
jgi:hypothetical protein